MIKSKLFAVVLANLLVVLLFFCMPSCLAVDQLCDGKAGILIEASSGRVLYEKNAYERLPMASTTKIATALTVLKHACLDEIVTVDKRAVGVEGSSVYLVEGEKLTVEDLLYGLMLRSGNDAAVALALHVGGSVDAFVALMNDCVKELGLVDTNFANPHGLHAEDHYTTAYDLAMITRYAMRNENFCQIVASKSTTIGSEEGQNCRKIVNKNKLLSNFEWANGVKTGFTKRAGRCFVGSAKKDGMQLIAVVLNCAPMFENAQTMLNFGFSRYTMTNIISKNRLFGVVYCKGKPNYYQCLESFSYPLTEQERVMVSKLVTLPDDGCSQAKVEVSLGDKTIFESKLTKY